MIKKIFILSFALMLITPAQDLRFGEVKGLFFSVGVGPRIPVGDFSETHNLGVGFSGALSYTDNLILPLFLYSDLGFQHFPGKQDYYKSSDHSSISTNMISLNIGARHYYSPLVENVILLMPIVEAGLSVSYSHISHQMKLDSGKRNFVEDEVKVGFHVGAGFSMFLLDAMVHYQYFYSRQYISFDLRVRLPVFVTY